MAPVFEQFALADQYATAKGSKICALSCNDAPVQVVATCMVKSPFEPGNFDKTWSARQTLQLRCGADVEDYFKGLDEWAIDYIAEHAERLLKKPMTREQVLAGYTSSLSQKGPNPTLLKTKINLEGPNACRFWASDGTERGPPTDWRASAYTPSLTIRYLWQMSGRFGWVVEVTDLLVIDPEAVVRRSPFIGRASPSS